MFVMQSSKNRVKSRKASHFLGYLAQKPVARTFVPGIRAYEKLLL
jgi:hypothetical protein